MPESVEAPDWRSAASLRILNMCRAVFSAISPPNTFSSAPREEDQLIIFMERLIKCTDKKEKKIFLKSKERQIGSVAKSYMRKGFLIYEKMRKYLTICVEAASRGGHFR
jgi:hypothetical protein